MFFRVENSFNLALLMNKIRSPDSYTRKLLCLFCTRIVILKENSFFFTENFFFISITF